MIILTCYFLISEYCAKLPIFRLVRAQKKSTASLRNFSTTEYSLQITNHKLNQDSLIYIYIDKTELFQKVPLFSHYSSREKLVYHIPRICPTSCKAANLKIF